MFNEHYVRYCDVIAETMNKAFVREPDAESALRCPACHGRGTEGAAAAAAHHLAESDRAHLAAEVWFCGNADCDVVYFDIFEQMVTVERLPEPVWPWSSTAPVCACFGLTLEDIIADAEDPEPLRIRALLQQSTSAEADCRTLAVSGQCCMTEVQKQYLRLRQGR